MASHFLQLNDRISQGEGAPADGDALSTSLSLFPIGAVYIDNNTGTLYVRNTVNGNAADWVSVTPGGVTPGIDDVLALVQPLAENRAIELNGHNLTLENGYFRLNNIAEFADNATALAGGVPNKGLYFTDVAGEAILKMARD